MKKSDLKTGMRVKMRDGDLCLVLKDCVTSQYGHQDYVFARFDGGFLIGSDYREDLFFSGFSRNSMWDIVEVYGIDDEISFVQENVLDKTKLYLLWSRPAPKEMTLSQIEAVLGYPVKVIGE